MLYRLLFTSALTGIAMASPQGGHVVSGNAEISQSGNATTITQSSQEAWIDWQSFSISSEEWVHFNQLVAEGLSVNRVTGDDLSEIFGQLTSNGTVYLVNPNGILFGEHANVDVGALFATDHWLSSDGSLNPTNKTSEGIRVLGDIKTREELTLLAESIQNSGTLNGERVSLIGSQGALLHLDDDGIVSVVVPANGEQTSWVENTGAIIANDQVYLGSAHKNDWLNSLAAENTVHVEGSISANTVDVQGTSVDLLDAHLSAELINIESQTTTNIASSTLHAHNNTIRIRGEEIQLHSGTEVDVGSGQLTIGGYYQGQGNDHNAQFVHVSSSVHLYGHGGENGHGGEIILWSDGTTSFHGTINAQGGTLFGDGGFVEVSGKETLVFRGDVSTYANNGAMGTLLLDPDTITIADGSGASADTDGTVARTDYNNTDITIFETDLEAIAAGTNISLQAEEAIIINDLTDGVLSLNQTGSVTFNVSNSAGEARFEMLDTNDSINMTGGGDLNIYLFGNTAIGSPGQTATMIVGDINFTAGGNLDLQATAEGTGTTSDDITIDVQDITVTGDGTVTIAINNTEDLDVGLTRIDVGAINITGTTAANDVTIFASNTNVGTAIAGTSTINLNGGIDVSGTGQTVSISAQEDGAVGGTINSNGDIEVPGGTITLSADRWELNQAEILLRTFNGANTPGSGFDIDAFTAIDGNGNSLRLRGGNDFNNIDFGAFTSINDLTFSLGADITLGNAGAGADIAQSELDDLNGSQARLILESNGSITSDNVNTFYNTTLTADNNSDGTGSVVLNGLVTNNGNLVISGADISGDGTATNTGLGTISINGAASQDISIGNIGTSTFNIESNVWNNMTSANHNVTVGSSSTIWWENGTLGNDTTLDASSGAGIVFQGSNHTFGGVHTLQLVGDSYFAVDLSMTAAGSSLDIDGDVHVGSVSGGGGDTVTVSGNWDTAGMTSIDLLGDAGDSAVLSHISDTDFAISNVTSANSVSLDILSDGSITASNLSVGDLLLDYDDDNDSTGANVLTLSGTNTVNGLTLSGSNTNDTATMGGTWTIGGDFTVLQTNVLNISSNSISANSVDMTTLNTMDLGSGSAFTLNATAGNLLMPANVSSDRAANFYASQAITIKDVTTSNDDVFFRSNDVIGGAGINIDVGTGELTFQQDNIDNNISVGDAGTETYNIEANIWDNITAGSLVLDATGTSDTITFLEDTLPADLTVQGADGAITFDGVPQSFVGASLTTNTDVLFLQDFTSDSVVEINGLMSVGATDAGAGDSITLSGNWNLTSAEGFELLGDDGDSVSFSHIGANFRPPAITSPNGDPNFSIFTRQSLEMLGFQGGDLTVTLDYDDNGANTFDSSGTFDLNDFQLTGNGGNDDADIDGTWTIGGEARFTTITDVTYLNNNFVATNDLHMGAGTTVTLGSSATTLNLTSTNGYVSFGDLTGNRPLNITAAGGVFAGEIDVASRDLSITSDSDLAGDEAIQDNSGDGLYIRAGDLTLAGDFLWTANPTISGNYTQTRGDITITDNTISAFGIDLNGADSITLSGTTNELEARAGNVLMDNALDDGSNANFVASATGTVQLGNLNTGTGNITLEADTDDSGGELIDLAAGTGGLLTLNSDASLTSTLSYSSIASTHDIAFNEATLTVDSLDTSTWASITLAGSNNTISATAGSITFANATDSGANANLFLNASGAINASNVNTGSGNQTFNSDTDTSGSEAVTLNGGTGGMLTLNDDATLSGTLSYTSLVASGAINLNNSALSTSAFDTSNYSSVSLTGTSNALTINGGDLRLDTFTIASGSDLSVSVGAGNHTLNNVDVETGDISINAVGGTSNQTVSANGDWSFESLTIDGIDTFVNNANLVGQGNVDVTVTDDIILNDGSTLSANELTFTAGDDITLTGVRATSQQIPSMVITAGGDLIDGGDTNLDLYTYWLDSVEFNIAGSQASLETFYEFGFDLDSVIEDIASIAEPDAAVIEVESDSNNPVDGVQASVGSLPKNRVDVFIPECTGNNKNCKKTNAVRKFLSALLVGGALPE